ncbi:(2Fe-2S)-binding protein [Paraburkholderia ginsengiterrae]|uniref:(2Fe-2S)-binding protein n=1 Tax=Paraburkholderia ginsengiterrae TaxID=1462993 RepID=A0A1A9MY31_9BURK|nr:Rieske 2Fe-2S domain-containing protein [Paraburkholderia ginsengiterrae]OAJ52333.1 (2Fe-2S)-binding protein [Paraburkholderia ginsengiterrae]OAJ63870.1 (2Fe-2S)-binding protein [Paraburkholderia ginsengiterrae]
MSVEMPVGAVGGLAPGERKLAFVGGRSVVLFNVEGTIHAIDNACPHNGASLASGQLDGNLLRCPAHGLRFDLTTGCMPGVAGLCLTKFAVRAVEGRLVVMVDEAAPVEPRP